LILPDKEVNEIEGFLAESAAEGKHHLAFGDFAFG
jgi:hypothetical protein